MISQKLETPQIDRIIDQIQITEHVKNLWNGFCNFFVKVGTARAAADLARMGYYREADSIIRKEFLK